MVLVGGGGVLINEPRVPPIDGGIIHVSNLLCALNKSENKKIFSLFFFFGGGGGAEEGGAHEGSPRCATGGGDDGDGGILG